MAKAAKAGKTPTARIIADETDLAEGLAWLARRDRRLRPVIRIAGTVPLRRQAAGHEGLARIIVGQQLSIASAEAIWRRFAAAFPVMDLVAICQAEDAALRATGLSAPKIRTLRAIAAACGDGLDLDGLAALPAEEAHARLVEVTASGRGPPISISCSVSVMATSSRPATLPCRMPSPMPSIWRNGRRWRSCTKWRSDGRRGAAWQRGCSGLITGCAASGRRCRCESGREDTMLNVREIGSFFAGGRLVNLTGKPEKRHRMSPGGPERIIDPNGDYVTGQCYVHFVRLAGSGETTPIMFWHGAGLTGASWETTPDGRPGWQMFFLERGHDSYVCDAVERGRAGWSQFPDIYETEPNFRTQDAAWAAFRIGEPGGYSADPAKRRPKAGTTFPVDAFDGLGAQFVPFWSGHTELALAAYFSALEQTGPVLLIGHSQGGNLGLEAATRHPEFFKAVVAVEPALAPTKIGAAVKVPHLIVWGDFIRESELWTRNRAGVEAYVERLRAAGGQVTVIDLPAAGIHGNSHFPMMDTNSDLVAERIDDWLAGR